MLAFFVSVMQEAHGFDWSGEQVRTFIMGLIAAGVGFCCRLLWGVREDTHGLKRDIRGDDKVPGLMDAVAGNTRRLEEIEKRNFKIDILDAAEKEMHPGVDRRQGPRRIRDQLADTYQTDEHSTGEKKK